MVDILDRVRNKALQSKIVTPEEAVELIKPGMTIATSGFPTGKTRRTFRSSRSAE